MKTDLIAKAEATIEAPARVVWHALTTPAAIKEYMFGTSVVTSWKVGEPIMWKGEWQGRKYHDKGMIKAFEPGHRLQYTHFSPLSGLPDIPENYHTVTIELTAAAHLTRVALQQDNNSTDEARRNSEKNWQMMLTALKRFLEEAKAGAWST